MRAAAASIALALGLLFAAPEARAEWIRDEIRINMRTGPGIEFRITEVLVSGDRVRVLSRGDDWVQVRNAAGEEGWIPEGYLAAEAPASQRLPEVELELEAARARIAELEAELAGHAERVETLTGVEERNLELESSNAMLRSGSRWRVLLTGGSIVLVGMLLGGLLARAGASRPRRLKL